MLFSKIIFSVFFTGNAVQNNLIILTNTLTVFHVKPTYYSVAAIPKPDNYPSGVLRELLLWLNNECYRCFSSTLPLKSWVPKL